MLSLLLVSFYSILNYALLLGLSLLCRRSLSCHLTNRFTCLETILILVLITSVYRTHFALAFKYEQKINII